jgi:hypothetical protein
VIRVWKGVALALLLGGCADTAAAQNAADRPLRRIEMAGGVGLFGGAALGGEDANLRANSLGNDPYRLFTADSTFDRSRTLEARLGMALTRRYAVEAGLSFSRPELRTAISADVEGAPGLTVVERVDQYVPSSYSSMKYALAPPCRLRRREQGTCGSCTRD